MTARRRRSAPVHDREAGFTLVEVLVALAIVALGATLAIRIGTDTATRERRVEAADLLSDEAESIVQVRAAAGTLRPGLEGGRFSDGRPWTLEVVDVAPQLGWRNVPPVLRARLTEGGADGRVIYVTVVGGGLG